MPKLNELHDRYGDQGLVLIGVHSTRGSEKMATFVDRLGIRYPVAADVDGSTVERFRVDSFPDYYVIDRAGNLRVADLSNDGLESAVRTLLAEPQPPAAPGPGDLARAWPRARYEYLDGGKPVGELVLSNRIQHTDTGRVILMEDELRIFGESEPMRIQHLAVAPTMELLRPRSAEVRVLVGGDPISTMKLKFEGDRASGIRNGERKALRIPALHVNPFTQIRAFALAGRRVGARTSYELFDTLECRTLGEQTLVCLGREEIEVGDRKRTTWHYQLTKPSGEHVELWFDEDRRLVRQLWDETKEFRLIP